MSLGYIARLEPRTRSDDLQAGLAARLYDATWILARQWQVGEFNGDDGGTPVAVRHRASVSWFARYADAAGSQSLAPGAGPLEARAESVAPPMTERRRVDLGRALLRRLRSASLDDRIPALLEHYGLTGGLAAGRIPDGGAILENLEAGLRATPATIPALPGLTVDAALVAAGVTWLEDCRAILGEPPGGAWDDERMTSSLSVDAPSPDGGYTLVAGDNGGGSLDWWAFDAVESAPDATAAADTSDTTTIPTRASFRGMPAPRWWQEEDASIDLGGVEANAADLARMALLQFALVFGTDHFVLPVSMPVGAIMRTTHLLVSDTFGATLALDPAGHADRSGRRGEGASRWTMFTLSLADGQGVADVFALTPSMSAAIVSRPLEEVHLLRDEMANLGWAVESIVEGDWGPIRRAEDPRPAQPTPPLTGTLRYRLGGSVPPNWFPMVPVRTAEGDVPRLVVERMADSTAIPSGELLRIGLAIDDDRLPREGRKVVRQAVVSRWTDGSARSWTRRQATIGRGEGSSGLTFDEVQEGDPEAG